eukprot:s4405_g3.t1
MTPFEVIAGHAYHSKLCEYACPVMVFIGDATKQKGVARWQRGIFLTKTWSNDMYLVAVGGTLRVTRAIKVLFPNWSEHIEEYRQVLTFPWQLEGNLGNRTFPIVRGEQPSALSVPGLDDEAAEDPDDAVMPPPVIEDLIPTVETSRRNTPPPRFAAVSAPASVPMTPDAVPSLGLPGPVTPGMEMDVVALLQKQLKRLKLVNQVQNDSGCLQCVLVLKRLFMWTLTQMNIFNNSMSMQFHFLMNFQMQTWNTAGILVTMHVITDHAGYLGELGSQLSAKFVRAWRKKTRKVLNEAGQVISESPGWLRRSRLVAREYNWMDIRDDVYSPSSSSPIVKLLPALALSDGFNDNCVIGTLDIADAFLQVSQPVPRVGKLGKHDFIILKCLPGQRDASKLWYLHFVETLKKRFGAEVCTEQPCVLKVGRKAAMILHVDDLLFMGDETELWYLHFVDDLEFKLSSTVVSRERGGSFEFLKRLHVVDAGYSQITVFPEAKHVCRLRHIRGRLLWLQEKVGSNEMSIKQVKTAYNIADLNTKALNKDRHLCLLYLLGFVSNDEHVGELEYSRMEAKEMLKQQIRVIRETVEDKTQPMSCSRSNRFAKQMLRVLSVCSVLGTADGKMFFDFAFFNVSFAKALSWWHVVSPMQSVLMLGFFFMLVAVISMIPRHAHESEPDPEQPEDSGQAEVVGEPSSEPPPSRYPMGEKPLGCKFAGVFSDPMFRCEGVLTWMCHRVEQCIARDNKPILNTMRKNELVQMMNLCMDGLSQQEAENLKDSMVAMSDLSDDELSPTYRASEETVRTHIAQAFQAYQVGMQMFGHLRRPARRDAEGDESEEETAEQRYYRYVRADYDNVSDPGEWMEIHGIEMQENELEESDEESPEARRRRYL